jgi:hypothetical protein
LLDRPDYLKTAQQMADQVNESISSYPSAYSNWLQLLQSLTGEHFEVAIVGELAIEKLREMQNYYLPQVIFCAGTSENHIPLLKNRLVPGKTLIYICQNNSCQLPVETVKEALRIISLL